MHFLYYQLYNHSSNFLHWFPIIIGNQCKDHIDQRYHNSKYTYEVSLITHAGNLIIGNQCKDHIDQRYHNSKYTYEVSLISHAGNLRNGGKPSTAVTELRCWYHETHKHAL